MTKTKTEKELGSEEVVADPASVINQPENVTVHQAPEPPVTPGSAITNILGSATRLCLVIMTLAACASIFVPSVNEGAMDVFRVAFGIVLGGFFAQPTPQSADGVTTDRMRGK